MGAIPAGAEIGVAITAPPQEEPEQELAATVGAGLPPQGGEGLSIFALENELGCAGTNRVPSETLEPGRNRKYSTTRPAIIQPIVTLQARAGPQRRPSFQAHIGHTLNQARRPCHA